MTVGDLLEQLMRRNDILVDAEVVLCVDNSGAGDFATAGELNIITTTDDKTVVVLEFRPGVIQNALEDGRLSNPNA